MDLIIIRYVHFIAIMLLTASLFSKCILVAPKVKKLDFKKIVNSDILFGISAVLVFITGFVLWFSVGKPQEFYTKNALFHIKFTLFFLMGLLSVYPTVFFFKNRKPQTEVVDIPTSVIVLVKTKFLILIIMPLLAALMAQGYGLK